MQHHIVQSGECLSSIAKLHGFYRWQTIYEAPENEQFRRLRPNPHVIYSGDQLVIPDKTPRQEPGATEARHKYRVNRSGCVFRLALLDEEARPVKGTPFRLFIEGRLVKTDRTDDSGRIEVPLQGDESSGRLEVLGEVLELKLGRLDPVTRVRGVQQRLNNLGFNAGPIDGIVGPLTRRATYRFQRTFMGEASATGVIDEETRGKLLQMHDNDDRLGSEEEPMDGGRVGGGDMIDDPDVTTEPLPPAHGVTADTAADATSCVEEC